MTEAPKKLEEVRELSWQMLARGAADKKDAFQTLTLVTYDGQRPDPRLVILRRFVRNDRTLICHTDVRAGKVTDLASHSQVAWLAWHPKSRIQLRIYGKGIVHKEGEMWESEWSKLSETSRLNYSSNLPPATAINKPEEGWESYVTFEQVQQGRSSLPWREQFCVIECQIEEMDWLMLRRGQHLRANFKWKEGKLEESWLVP